MALSFSPDATCRWEGCCLPPPPSLPTPATRVSCLDGSPPVPGAAGDQTSATAGLNPVPLCRCLCSSQGHGGGKRENRGQAGHRCVSLEQDRQCAQHSLPSQRGPGVVGCGRALRGSLASFISHRQGW